MNIFQKIGEIIDDVLLPDEALQALRRGEKALVAQQLEQAIQHFYQAISIKSDHPEPYYKLGLAYYYAGQYDAAKKAARQALIYREEFPQVYNLMGLIALKENDPKLALRLFKKTMQLNPDLPETHEYMGRAYAARNQHPQALTAFRKALRLQPDALSTQLGLAESALEVGDHPTARQTLQTILQKKPQHSRALFLLGRLELAEGNAAEAVLYLQGAVATSQRQHTLEVQQMLARAYLYHDKLDSAQELLEGLITRYPQSVETHLLLADVYLRGKHPDQVLDQLQPFLDADLPESQRQNIHLLWGRAALQLNKPEQAKAAFEHVTTANPDQIEGWELLAQAEMRLHQFSAAIQTLQKALSLAPDNPHLYLALAECQLSLKQYPAAIESAKIVLKFDPENLNAKKIIEISHSHRTHDQTDSLAEHASNAPAEFVFILDKLYRTLDFCTHVADFHPFQTDLFELISTVRHLRESLDLPLLVTIMGEFNTGKSTFINSFIGENVAPMGIRPTTATINYLKFGTMKKLRIVWQSGEVEEAEITRLAEYVDERQADTENIRQIQWVEILYPLEILKEVNIVDTPGLNVSLTEHEALTKNFVERADAVIWLFAVDQAGKQTEKEALAFLKSHAKKTVGVVNKIDVVSPEETQWVIDEVQQELAEYVAGVVGISAKQALRGQIEGKPDQVAQSGFHQLDDFLNETIFQHSRQIKYQSIIHQLTGVLRQMDSIEPRLKSAAAERVTQLEQAQNRLNDLQQTFQRRWIPDQMERFKKGLNKMYLELAQYLVDSTVYRGFFEGEVLSPEDQQYLRTQIESGFQQVIQQCETALRAECTAAGISEDSVQTVYRELEAYFAGVLDAGTLAEALKPTQDFNEAIEQFRAFHPPAAKIRLQQGLNRWQERFFVAQKHEYSDRLRAHHAQQLEIEWTVFQPLAELRQSLQSLSDQLN